jgi:sulfur carrier protein ThiS
VTATLTPVGVLRTLAWTDDPPDRASVTVEHGQTLESACLEAGVRSDLVALFLVNGQAESGDYVLNPGDEARLVALVGGG